MAHRSTRIPTFLVVVSLLSASAASAQERGAAASTEPLVFGSGATYEVKFDDDPLAALPNGVIIPRITVRDGVGSPRLMRARTQFVVELLKSAETF